MKFYKLSECIELVIDYRGKTPKKLGGDWVEEGVRVISALNVHNGYIDNEEKIRCVSDEVYKKWMQIEVKRDDCFIASEGASLGENAIWDSDEKIVLGQRLYAVRTNPNILDPWYFAMYMQTKKFHQQIHQISTGSTVFGISQPILLSMPLALPPIKEQRKIGKLYKMIHRKIKLNEKINFELENIAKTIYDYWFLQFEFPNDEGKPYKSSGGKMVWNEELKKEIPDGWEVTQIDSVLSVVPSTRKKLKKEYLSRGKYPVIDQSSVYISGFTDDEKAVLFLKDAVVFGDHTKIIKYINFDFCRGADGTQILLSNRENLPNILLYHQVKNLNLVSQGYSRYFKFLKEKQIILPNFEIAKQFKITSEKLYQKIRSNIFENQELTFLRDYLLPLLMNGQVGFKD